jgi:hypothetical protein
LKKRRASSQSVPLDRIAHPFLDTCGNLPDFQGMTKLWIIGAESGRAKARMLKRAERVTLV